MFDRIRINIKKSYLTSAEASIRKNAYAVTNRLVVNRFPAAANLLRGFIMKLNKYGIKSCVGPIIWIALTGLCYFLAAGRTDIAGAWAYFIFYAAGGTVLGIVSAFRIPELMNERGRMKKDSKSWDRLLVLLYFVLLLIVVPIFAGLDLRYGWLRRMPFFTFFIGAGLYVFSLFISFASLLRNPYFEGNVRIQTERGHRVIDKGPYACIRHPGYVGMILGSLALGFALRSGIGMIPAASAALLVILRTYLEDTTLQNELPGYREYAKRVKYRLIPFIW